MKLLQITTLSALTFTLGVVAEADASRYVRHLKLSDHCGTVTEIVRLPRRAVAIKVLEPRRGEEYISEDGLVEVRIIAVMVDADEFGPPEVAIEVEGQEPWCNHGWVLPLRLVVRHRTRRVVWQACGDAALLRPGSFRVRTRATGCRTGRAVAAEWSRRALSDGNFRQIGPYACSHSRIPSGYRVRCSHVEREGKAVRFDWLA